MEGAPLGNQGSFLMPENKEKKKKNSENYVEINVMFWYSIVVGMDGGGNILEIIFFFAAK